MKIKHTNEALILGRNTGIAFGFVKNNETLMPISTCKDYLGDFIYAEHKNTKVTKYGFSHTGSHLIDDDLRLAFTMHHIDYVKRQNLLEDLRKRYKVVEKFVNSFGMGEVKIKKRGDYYIVNIPPYFLKSTYLISVFSFMIRLGIRVTHKSTTDNFKINKNYYVSKKEKIDHMQVHQFKKVKKIMHKYETNPDGLTNNKIHDSGMMKMK